MGSGMWKSTQDHGISPKYFNVQKRKKNLNKFGGERGGGDEAPSFDT